jgi:hypothetical protein
MINLSIFDTPDPWELLFLPLVRPSAAVPLTILKFLMISDLTVWMLQNRLARDYGNDNFPEMKMDSSVSVATVRAYCFPFLAAYEGRDPDSQKNAALLRTYHCPNWDVSTQD